LWFEVLNNNGGQINAGPTDFGDEQWHHVAVTVHENITFFFDGLMIQSGNRNFPRSFAGKAFRFGSNFEVDHWLDEFRLWNHVRNQSEIQETMSRTLRANEMDDMVLYYTFDRDDVETTLTVVNKAPGAPDYLEQMVLGFQDIGSVQGKSQFYERSAPSFVASSAPIYEAPVYVTIGKPYQTPDPQSQTVALPYPGSEEVTTTLMSLPDNPGIEIKLTNGTIVDSVPFSFLGRELVIGMKNKDVTPLKTSFKYRLSTSLKSSGVATVNVQVVNEFSPGPGGAGRSLKCDGKISFFISFLLIAFNFQPLL